MPIEKEKRPLKDKPSDMAIVLQRRCINAKLDPAQTETWKADVAEDLNTILARVQYHLTSEIVDESDIDFARAALRTIARVAEFEGIRRAGK